MLGMLGGFLKVTCETVDFFTLSMVKTEKRKIGDTGEDVACEFLTKKGFSIVERNYLKKWGEIDIIAKNKKEIHFVEVKTISCENIASISRETSFLKNPEENIHHWKVKRLSRAIRSYLLDRNVTHETPWKFDMIAVFLDLKNRQAKVRFSENVIL